MCEISVNEIGNNGIAGKAQDVRILVLLPANDANVTPETVKDEWDRGYADKYNVSVDFCIVKNPVTKLEDLKTVTCLQARDDSFGDKFDPNEIVNKGEYCLGIAYGDWLNYWINHNSTLTPGPKKAEKAKLPFILITTDPISVVQEPHLKAYPGEKLVGMLLAQLMKEAVDRDPVNYGTKWRAFFFENGDKNTEEESKDSNAKEIGCREAFEENVESLGLNQDGKVFVFDSNAITFNSESIVYPKKGDETKEADERFRKKFQEACGDAKLFCVYAASAPNAEAYGCVVKAINELATNEKKILVTDACWEVPQDDCKNLQIAQLCGTRSRTTQDNLLVGKKLFCWLIPVLLELALKTMKWCRGIKVPGSEQEKSIVDLITEFGPLMVVQGTTFSFIEREMFIPFSYNFRGGSKKWNSSQDKPAEEIRSAEEAHEAVAVAMSRIEKAADEFRKNRVGGKSENLKTGEGLENPKTGANSESLKAEEGQKKSLDDATVEFAEDFGENVLKPCFAAKEVFFVDDKYKHLKVFKEGEALGAVMPKKSVHEVAENSRVIQIAYNKRNIENTEAVRLYRVCKINRDSCKVVPVADSLLKWSCSDSKTRKSFFADNGFSPEAEIFCSRSQRLADDKWSEHSKKDNSSDKWDLGDEKLFEWLILSNREMSDQNKSVGRFQYNYLYYVPAYNWDGSGCMPAVAFFSDVKFCDFELSALKMVVTRFYSVLYTEDRVRKVKISAVRAAIGAIMSRNGSHNIGSHVLASLSHHVGTCPDDRVMYQYIQHRMDYIAMASTDFPNWRQPMRLVGDLMKAFLCQRHLLDGIAKSEGLKAYQFQNGVLPVEQPNTIRLHARRVLLSDGELTEREKFGDRLGTVSRPENEKYYLKYCPSDLDQDKIKNFVVYPDLVSTSGEGKSDDSNFSNDDVDVAITGGEVGQQAFFTIIENVLRNAAKHSWANMNDEKKKSKCLNVYLDFQERHDDGNVECIIWTDLGATVDVLEGLAEKVSQKFVRQDGQLRRENLGLAEMRIAAGFLKGADIREIGGQKGAKACLDLICPVDVVQKDDKAKEERHYGLGYRFVIPKPRELLVLTSKKLLDKSLRGGSIQGDQSKNCKCDQPKDLSSNDVRKNNFSKPSVQGDVPKSNDIEQMDVGNSTSGEVSTFLKGMRRHGVWVKSWEEFCKDKDGAFSFVILEGGIAKDFFQKQDDKSRYDKSRLALKRLPFRTIAEGNAETWKGCFGRYVAVISEEDGIVGGIRNAIEGNGQVEAEDLLKKVYKIWIDTLKKNPLGTIKGAEVKKDTTLSVVVDVSGAGESPAGEGRGLVDKSDILYYVLEKMLDSAIDSYREWKKWNKVETSVEVGQAFDLLKGMKLRLLTRADRADVKSVIAHNVEMWRDEILESENIKGYDLLGRLITERGEATNDLEDFSVFIDKVILAQVKAILSGCMEQITTLPKSWVGNELDRVHGNYTWEGVAKVLFVSDDTERTNCDNVCLAFCRHLTFGETAASDEYKGMLYVEPLSGSQSYFNALRCLGGRVAHPQMDDFRLMARMLECGLLRVLIIDERMKKFKTEHADIARTFDHIRVGIMDDTDVDVKNLFADYQYQKVNMQNDGTKNVLTDYEIVIIHMGIIDKLLPDHEKSEAVGKFVTYLQRKSHYVVVTTGRGAPPNLPPDARVLSFSLVESAMFSRYPEKMILVDNVMNVLPRRGEV